MHHVFLAAPLEHYRLHSLEMEQMREHQASGPDADDGDARAHLNVEALIGEINMKHRVKLTKSVVHDQHTTVNHLLQNHLTNVVNRE